MARSTRSTHQEKAAQLHERLATQVEELCSSDGWRQFLAFISSFRSYSLNNTLLIMSQRPTATQVAGYVAWQKKGRQVRKGETSIKILGYSVKTSTETDPDTGEETERAKTWFPVRGVFDISQTDPMPGAVDHSTITRRLTGADDHGIAHAATEYLTSSLGWTVDREPIPGTANGYATADGTRRVVVDSSLDPAQVAKTLLHEAAHVVLGHTNDNEHYHEHRGVSEVEAESVAYVLAGVLGLDTSAYSVGYVARWADGDSDAVRGPAERVLAAVQTLTTALVDETADNTRALGVAA